MGQYEAYIAQYAIDGVSILCSLVTIVIVLWVWKIYPASKESPSFNLTIWIAVADIPARISDIFSIPLNYPNGFPQSRVFARFFMWLNYVSIFWFIYLTCMIVLDLQLVFFHRLPRQARIRRWYPVLGSLIAFLLAIPYLCFPNVRISYNGALMVGYEDSAALKVFVLWTQVWMHAGIIYSIIVVVAVCVKIFVAQSQLRRFASNNLNKTVSRSLIHNTSLIIAYPVVLFVVYVPYILQSWFLAHVPGIFTYRWGMFTAIAFATQGIFSFIIVLFHPVMLSTYRHSNFGLNSLWSQMSRWRHGSHCDTSNGSGTLLYPLTSTAHNSPIGNPVLGAQTCPPQVKTMDMGPGVTGLFDSTFRINSIQTTTDGEEKPNDPEVMTAIHVANSELNESALGSHHSFDEATYL